MQPYSEYEGKRSNDKERERESSKYTKFNYVKHTVICTGDINGKFH